MLTVTSNAAVTLSALKNGASTVNSANYTFANNILTIKATYLATLADGAKTFTLDFAEADDVSVAVTVVTGNTVDDATESFSKANSADVVFVITPEGEATLTALKIGDAVFDVTNYTYVNGTLTIKAAYLANVEENGDVVFTAVMSAYNDIDLTITVTD